MARAPGYEQRTSAQSGGPLGLAQTPDTRDSLGRSLANVGDATTGAAFQVQQAKDRQLELARREQIRVEAQRARMDGFKRQAEYDDLFSELASQAPEDGAGFTDTLAAELKRRRPAAAANYQTPEVRDMVELDQAQLEEQLHHRARAFEADRRGKAFVSQFKESTSLAERSVYADTSRYTDQVQRLGAVVDNFAGLDDSGRRDLKRDVTQKLGLAAGRADIERNPYGVLHELAKEKPALPWAAGLEADDIMRMKSAAQSEVNRRESEARQREAEARAVLHADLGDAFAARQMGIPAAMPARDRFVAAYGAKDGATAYTEAAQRWSAYDIAGEVAFLPPEQAAARLEAMKGNGAPGAAPAGLRTPGNLDPFNRKILNNPDGSYSTTSSISIGTDQGEVLIPTVVDGKRLSNDEAIAHYRQTGEHLGVFDTPEHADAFATDLHNRQAAQIENGQKGAAGRLEAYSLGAKIYAEQRRQLEADPVGVLSRADPGIAAARERLVKNPQDPAAVDGYFRGLVMRQHELGIKEPKLLPEAQRETTAANLTFDPAHPQARVQRLAGMKQSYGDWFDQVIGEIAPKLDGHARVLVHMTPEAAGKLDAALAQKPELEKLVAGTKARDITDTVDAELQDLGETLAFDVDGPARLAEHRDAAILYARSLVARGGDPTNAAKQAAAAVVNDQYTYRGGVRIPKGLDDGAVMDGADTLRDRAATEGNLRINVGRGSDAGAAQKDMAALVKSRGFWVTEKDGSGLALYIPHRAGMGRVYRSDGAPLHYTWNQLAAAARGAQVGAIAGRSPNAD